MRKLVLAVLLLLLLYVPARAQEPLPFSVYLPIIMSTTNLDCMSNGWRFIAATQTTNVVLNPSGETTGNFAAVAGATVTQVSTFQKYGLQSYRVQTAANKQGLQLTLGSTLTSQNYYATARVRGKLPPRWGFILKDSPYIQAQLLETLGDGWFTYGVRFDGARANGSTFLRIGQIGAGSGDFYVDGVQVEPTEPTTYCDGTQPGCAWDGAPNASTSTRSGQSRAGGKILDFFDDYGFFVQKVVGGGAVTPTVSLDPYALLPGGELNSIKLQSRTFTLIGKFIADTEQELHDNRQLLITALASDTFPDNQPVKLRFYGARVPKEISAYYQGGLEGDLAAFYNKTFAPIENDQWENTSKFVEMATIQFVAPDPMWYEIGESAAALDVNDLVTVQTVAGRLRSTGQWSALGPPNAAGTYSSVNAIVEDATYVYIGGNFLNWDNIAAGDNIVRLNKQTGVYTALDVGLNNVVRALAIAPNGDLYVGGEFTNASGVAAADYLAVWASGATAFAAVGIPLTGAAAISSVAALVFDHSGNLFIGGNFQNWNNIAAADQIVMWNGATYSAVGTGANGQVLALAVANNNLLYIGGVFTTFNGVGAVRVASWDGTTALALSSGANSNVAGLAVDPATNILYLAGAFTTIGGITVGYSASWNGTAFSPLSSGFNAQSSSVAVGPDGVVYFGGGFSTAGGVPLSDSFTRWNVSSFAHPDIDLPGGPTVSAILASGFVDPAVVNKYSTYIGFNTTGSGGSVGGKVTVSNGGSSPAFPKIVYNRSGGANAPVIASLRNETNGQEILFNYSLLTGETLTIDLAPTQKSVVSSFFGPRLDAVLPNGDFGEWAIPIGSSEVTTFLFSPNGAITATGYMLWRDTFKSYD